MAVFHELEPPFRTMTGATRSTVAGRSKEGLNRSGQTELAPQHEPYPAPICALATARQEPGDHT